MGIKRNSGLLRYFELDGSLLFNWDVVRFAGEKFYVGIHHTEDKISLYKYVEFKKRVNMKEVDKKHEFSESEFEQLIMEDAIEKENGGLMDEKVKDMLQMDVETSSYKDLER